MTSTRIRFAGDFGGLAALGLEDARPLFEPEEHLEQALGPRVALERAGPGRVVARFPLPGTPDARGSLTGRPGELGTGWLRLTSFDAAPLRVRLRARCTAPRSASLAEREWNLLCLLRAAGVATPEPLVVGARGAGLVARSSFLLVRELEGALTLPRWLHPSGLAGLAGERERGLMALAAMLERLWLSGILLPGLAPEQVWVTPAGGGDCEHEEPGATSPRRNRLPGIAIERATEGRATASAAARRARLEAFVEALGEALAADERELLRAGFARAGAGPAARR